MINVTTKGDWGKTNAYLERLSRLQLSTILNKYGQMGVDALANATPVESGRTAQSWYYEIESRRGYHSITWYNSNVNDGVPIAVIIQYGHGTGTGGYVAGQDYINPAIRPIFDRIADEVWKEVTK